MAELVREWYDNGNISTEYVYKNGKRDGPFRVLYPNGRPIVKGYYIDNNLEGVIRSWYDTGILWEESIYRNGKKNGKSTTWRMNGELSNTRIYLDGYFVTYV